ncbi:MAG: DUF3326 domain-containing protein [Candidatus Aminicenantes bacterium]|nr:DUF3326 domain-containing protein [Candidatus Aminicenantes bacterium]
MISNVEFKVNRSEFNHVEELPGILSGKFGSRILRWFISKVTGNEVCVELTLSEKEEYPFPQDRINEYYPGKSVVVSIIPTGIGCEIGGYAADAAPAGNLLASCTDYLITNPNAVNASNFISMADNVLYTEGFIIDQFCKGVLNLYQPYANKVGLIIEKSSKHELEVIFNVTNAVRAVHGVDIEHCVITDGPIGGRCERNKSGSYVGQLEDPGVLFRACDELVAKGVNAIAVASNIKDLPTENYAKHFAGKHPNPIGGAEAIISHLICAKYRIPAAHAPLSNIKEMPLENNIVDARGAGEFASESGLACVLVGLRRAPQISPQPNCRIKNIVNVDNLLAIAAPSSALGGIPTLYAHKNNIPIIAVKNNGTILDVTRDKLNLGPVVEVENYAEAAGVIQALRKGISLRSIIRPLSTLRF